MTQPVTVHRNLRRLLLRCRSKVVIHGEDCQLAPSAHRPVMGHFEQSNGIAATGNGESNGFVWLRRDSRQKRSEISPEPHYG